MSTSPLLAEDHTPAIRLLGRPVQMKHGPSTGPDEMPGPASFRMKFPSSVSPQRQTCRLCHPGCEVTTILQWFCESRNLYNQVLSPGGSEHKSFLPSLQLCLQIVRRRRGPRARQGHSVEGHGGSPWLGTGLQGHLIFFVCTSPLTICFSQSWPQDKLPALVLTMLVSKKIQKTQVQMPGSGLRLHVIQPYLVLRYSSGTTPALCTGPTLREYYPHSD